MDDGIFKFKEPMKHRTAKNTLLHFRKPGYSHNWLSECLNTHRLEFNGQAGP